MLGLFLAGGLLAAGSAANTGGFALGLRMLTFFGFDVLFFVVVDVLFFVVMIM
jgi:hypothetical protein